MNVLTIKDLKDGQDGFIDAYWIVHTMLGYAVNGDGSVYTNDSQLPDKRAVAIKKKDGILWAQVYKSVSIRVIDIKNTPLGYPNCLPIKIDSILDRDGKVCNACGAHNYYA